MVDIIRRNPIIKLTVYPIKLIVGILYILGPTFIFNIKEEPIIKEHIMRHPIILFII